MGLLAVALLHPSSPSHRGVLLEDLTWVEAEKRLTPDAVVVIPLGAQSKEHGPHLKLKNDFLMAEYLRERVRERADVVIAPTVNYHFYPAFTEYPGSTSLQLETARDLIVDICRGLSRFGPRRFYVLNTGVSTVRALAPAAEILAETASCCDSRIFSSAWRRSRRRSASRRAARTPTRSRPR